MRTGMLGAMGLGAMVVLGGCGARAVVPDPTAITLKSALTEVGEGLAAMVKAQPQSSDFGIYPAEVTVSFNVQAGGTSSGSLLVTPGTPEVSAAGDRTGLKASVSETAQRGNCVTVKFVNVLFAPQDALVHHVTGAQLFELRQAMLGIDPRPMMVPVSAMVTPMGQAGSANAGATTAPNAGTTGAPVAATPGAGATPVRASLPAMRFLSPFKPEEDPAGAIRSMSGAKLGVLARAINARVGMEVVRTDAPEGELRQQLLEATQKLTINKAEIESMSGGASK